MDIVIRITANGLRDDYTIPEALSHQGQPSELSDACMSWLQNKWVTGNISITMQAKTCRITRGIVFSADDVEEIDKFQALLPLEWLIKREEVDVLSAVLCALKMHLIQQFAQSPPSPS